MEESSESEALKAEAPHELRAERRRSLGYDHPGNIRSSLIFWCRAGAVASENGARMTAMDLGKPTMQKKWAS